MPAASDVRTGRATSPKRPAGKRRDREVVDAAARIFYDRGYSNTTVQDVADALGILKGSLYHYIDTKEDLLYRLLIEVHDEVKQILDEVIAVPDLAPLDRLALYVRRQVEFNCANLIKISVYYHDVGHLTGARKSEVVKLRRVHDRYVLDLIREAQENGQADPSQDPRVLANCVFGTVIWVYRWYQPGGKIKREEIGEICAAYALNGLRPPT